MSLYRTDNNGRLIKIAGNPTNDNVELLETIIADRIQNKVDKVTGKGLSTNDYTTEEKNKLAGIASGANKTTIDTALSTTSTNPVRNSVVTSNINTINTNLTNLTTKVNNILLSVYPVGSLYFSTSSTNPSTLFGGTWEAYAQGRTIIGVGTSDQAFSAGATGGASNHTLTTAQMPSHTHTQNGHNHTANSKSWKFWWAQFSHKDNTTNAAFIANWNNADNTNVTMSRLATNNNTGAIGSGSNWGYRKTQAEWDYTPSINNTTATNQNTGGGGSHNNLQPYIVTYIWKRTA